MNSGTITLGQFKEDPERFFKAAKEGRITITENGSPMRVLIDISEWERLSGKKDTRRAFSPQNAPEHVIDDFEGEYQG